MPLIPANKRPQKRTEKVSLSVCDHAALPQSEGPSGVWEEIETLPTRSSAGRAQSASRARSSCSRQLPGGSIVSTFTQVPGLEETGKGKRKTTKQKA